MPSLSRWTIQPDILKIGIVTDCHQNSGGYYNDTNTANWLTDAKTSLTTWKPHLQATIGDNIYDNSSANYSTQVGNFLSRWRIGETPLIIGTGNHDFYGTSQTESTTRSAWPSYVTDKWVASRCYGSFDICGFHIVMLDPNYYDGTNTHESAGTYALRGHIDTTQMTWLNNDLAAATNPIIIFSHQSPGTWQYQADHEPIDNATTLRSNIASNAAQPVVGVFNGHMHRNLSETNNSIKYVSLNSLHDETNDAGYLTHNKGCHHRLIVNRLSHAVSLETWEDDSTNGYLNGNTTTWSY